MFNIRKIRGPLRSVAFTANFAILIIYILGKITLQFNITNSLIERTTEQIIAC